LFITQKFPPDYPLFGVTMFDFIKEKINEIKAFFDLIKYEYNKGVIEGKKKKAVKDEQ
jgi:hypothetical protein